MHKKKYVESVYLRFSAYFFIVLFKMLKNVKKRVIFSTFEK